LLDIVPVGETIIAEDVAVIPELLNDVEEALGISTVPANQPYSSCLSNISRLSPK
jgi:hypothetical protein